METKELLDKYTRIIAGLLSCNVEWIKVKKEGKVFESQEAFNNNVYTLEYKEVGELYYIKPEDEIENNWSEGKYIITCKDKIVSTFELYKMPHCCAILVSCRSTVNSGFRNKRIGTALNILRQDIGRLLGYSLLFCTDIESNKYQRKLLATNGWKDIYDVKNKRTGNKVFLSVINL